MHIRKCITAHEIHMENIRNTYKLRTHIIKLHIGIMRHFISNSVATPLLVLQHPKWHMNFKWITYDAIYFHMNYISITHTTDTNTYVFHATHMQFICNYIQHNMKFVCNYIRHAYKLHMDRFGLLCIPFIFLLISY